MGLSIYAALVTIAWWCALFANNFEDKTPKRIINLADIADMQVEINELKRLADQAWHGGHYSEPFTALPYTNSDGRTGSLVLPFPNIDDNRRRIDDLADKLGYYWDEGGKETKVVETKRGWRKK